MKLNFDLYGCESLTRNNGWSILTDEYIIHGQFHAVFPSSLRVGPLVYKIQGDSGELMWSDI